MTDLNQQMAEQVAAGHVAALARLISLIEDEDPRAPEVLKHLGHRRGHAHIIGITGPPGAGKSTLTDLVAKHLRAENRRVGILAVDPTSPFTGGALLGDRTRMQDLATDPEVFIRSMGTRGSLGGLAQAVYDAIKALEAAGKDYILVETVGVGQSEVDIARTADTVLVLFVPGLGDDVQAIKAGITEIADIFVVNKADLPGAARIQTILEHNLRFDHPDDEWLPPILMTSAARNEGVDELMETISQHFEYLVASDQLENRRLRRYRAEVVAGVQRRATAVADAMLAQGAFDEALLTGESTPHQIVDVLWSECRKGMGRDCT